MRFCARWRTELEIPRHAKEREERMKAWRRVKVVQIILPTEIQQLGRFTFLSIVTESLSHRDREVFQNKNKKTKNKLSNSPR